MEDSPPISRTWDDTDGPLNEHPSLRTAESKAEDGSKAHIKGREERHGRKTSKTVSGNSEDANVPESLEEETAHSFELKNDEWSSDNQDSTSAGNVPIKPFHPDLYEFIGPWGRAVEQGKGQDGNLDSSAIQPADEVGDSKVQASWQAFEDDFQVLDDWQSFAEYEEDATETPEDLELLRALTHRESNPGKAYRSWRTYVDSLVDPETETEPLNRTIHMLGLGATGKYIAHSLASLPFAPPITLLMHRPLMMQHWHDEGAAIHVVKGGKVVTQSNFHIESSAEFAREDSRQRFPGFGPRLEHSAEPPNYPIDTLIVTTETYRTVSALTAIKHRLRHKSTIFFVNDGLGLAERVNEKVFPDPYQRPTYVLGNMTHNLVSTERHFTLIERNSGRLECSKLPQVFISQAGRHSPVLRRNDYSWTAGASHLVGTLARTPQLSTATLGHKSFYLSQLQNLVAGAVIGPLSVVFDCTNDYLLYNYNASQTMKFLLSELSHVICSLPELRNLSNVREIFSVKRLESVLVSKIVKSGKNLSSMLKAVRAGNRTDIMFYNGYLDRRAKELGIDTPRNEMMLHLVRGKSAAKSREMNNYIPFEDDY